jgi:hypothetical protein
MKNSTPELSCPNCQLWKQIAEMHEENYDDMKENWLEEYDQ